MPVWNADKPANSDIVSDFPTDSQANILLPFQGALSKEHVFSGTYGSTAGRHESFEITNSDDTAEILKALLRELGNDIPTSTFKLEINQANPQLLKLIGYTGAAAFLGLMELTQFTKAVTIAGDLSAKMNQIIYPGTRIFFPQETVPTGWTRVATFDDAYLRVVDGTGTDIGAAEGGTHDPDTISDFCIDGIAGAHSHNNPDIPIGNNDSSVLTYAAIANYNAAKHPHSHTSGSQTSTSVGNHVHGFASDAAWRPAYLDSILGEKDS